MKLSSLTSVVLLPFALAAKHKAKENRPDWNGNFVKPLDKSHLQSLTNVDELVKFLSRNEPWSFFPSFLGKFNALSKAIQMYQQRDGLPEFSELLQKISGWAAEVHHPKLNILHNADKAHPFSDSTYSSFHARHILANAFLLNMETTHPSHIVGSINLKDLYSETIFESSAKHRILALLLYFVQADDEETERTIHIERFNAQPLYPIFIKTIQNTKNIFTKSSIKVDTLRMEDFSNATGFVDFANQYLNVHDVRGHPPAQEEILFTVCPEAMVAMLLSPGMTFDEVIVLRNVRRFVEYEGYSKSFKVVGKYHERKIFDILAMDAHVGAHFENMVVLRDTMKAFAAFSSFNGAEIVTGKWFGDINAQGLRCFWR